MKKKILVIDDDLVRKSVEGVLRSGSVERIDLPVFKRETFQKSVLPVPI